MPLQLVTAFKQCIDAKPFPASSQLQHHLQNNNNNNGNNKMRNNKMPEDATRGFLTPISCRLRPNTPQTD